MSDAKDQYRDNRRAHWDSVAREIGSAATWGGFYHKRLTEIYKSLVFPGLRVIEIGCGHGDLLAALQPAFGLGVDFSSEMIRVATERHPELRFIEADAHELELNERFDVIILSDLVNDLWDVQDAFVKMASLADRNTRVIINLYSRVWELPLAATERLGLARPTLNQNWLTVEDISDLLELADFQVIRHWSEILCPLGIPFLAGVCNRFLVKLWPFRLAALTNFVVARPAWQRKVQSHTPLVSVIVPARNEEGNISQIMQRVPEMGSGTELVFVEGHSTDDTYGAIERAIPEHPHRRCKLFRQTGEGKGDAVRMGFEKADGDILMILDADMTVPPEDLQRFYDALVSGKGEFINGVRLVYPMEDQAMRFLNLVGNRIFSLCFSFLLGQNIKDTLCGTKVLWKDQYE
ncbi:MAG TPA: glycosyltransferase, partial [Desulfomonilaceae bacterium]|nr:glycosyltransferase [Desulfomonilaceae bacterium]